MTWRRKLPRKQRWSCRSMYSDLPWIWTVSSPSRAHNLKVLEDSAGSGGCLYKGRRTGSMGGISIFSFQFQKMITSGEGGAVVMNDPHLYERAIRYHDLGQV